MHAGAPVPAHRKELTIQQRGQESKVHCCSLHQKSPESISHRSSGEEEIPKEWKENIMKITEDLTTKRQEERHFRSNSTEIELLR